MKLLETRTEVGRVSSNDLFSVEFLDGESILAETLELQGSITKPVFELLMFNAEESFAERSPGEVILPRLKRLALDAGNIPRTHWRGLAPTLQARTRLLGGLMDSATGDAAGMVGTITGVELWDEADIHMDDFGAIQELTR